MRRNLCICAIEPPHSAFSKMILQVAVAAMSHLSHLVRVELASILHVARL
jgi:hypothetical protein